MARRSDHSRDELKKLTLDASYIYLSEVGLTDLSMRKIANKIGYSVGTLYNIFKNNDDLILHVNAMTLDKMYLYLEKNKIDEKDIRVEIKKLAHLYYHYANDNYNCWISLFEHHRKQDEELPLWYQQKIEKLFSLIEVQLIEASIDANDAKIAARSLWAGIQGICQLGLTGNLGAVGILSIEKLIDDLVENYLNGLKI